MHMISLIFSRSIRKITKNCYLLVSFKWKQLLGMFSPYQNDPYEETSILKYAYCSLYHLSNVVERLFLVCFVNGMCSTMRLLNFFQTYAQMLSNGPFYIFIYNAQAQHSQQCSPVNLLSIALIMIHLTLQNVSIKIMLQSYKN